MAKGDAWNEGLAVQVDLSEKAKVSLIPVVVTKTGIDLASKEKTDEILSGIELRNADLLNGKWQEHWHNFCVSMEEQYKNAVAGFYNGGELDIELFAHYLDCEAHTDVWRELYPTFHKAKISQ